MTDADVAAWLEGRLVELEARRVTLAATDIQHVSAANECRAEMAQIDVRLPALRVELAELERAIADAAEAAAQ